jgi:hypothetical protein
MPVTSKAAPVSGALRADLQGLGGFVVVDDASNCPKFVVGRRRASPRRISPTSNVVPPMSVVITFRPPARWSQSQHLAAGIRSLR